MRDFSSLQIEGLFTVVVGLVFVVFFPKSISNPVSIMGIRYLNDREVYILSNRVLHDDPTKAHAGLNVSWAELKATVIRDLPRNPVQVLPNEPCQPRY